MGDVENTNLQQNGEVESQYTEKLWENSDPKASEMYKFIQHVNQKYSKDISNYDGLYHWSIENTSEFWDEVWKYTGMIGSEYTKVRVSTQLLNVN
jgi:hypothetical protein